MCYGAGIRLPPPAPPGVAADGDGQQDELIACQHIAFTVEGATEGCLNELEEEGWGPGSITRCRLYHFDNDETTEEDDLWGMRCFAVLLESD